MTELILAVQEKRGQYRLQSADLIGFFKRSPIFASLDEDELKKIAVLATPRHFKKGEFIILEGDTPPSFSIIQEGRVKVFKQSSSGKDFTVGVFHRGDTFGEVAVFDGKPCSASTQAMDEATILTIPREEFLSFVAQNPTVAIKIIGIIGERVKSAHDRLRDLTSDRVEQRLTKILLMLSSKCGPSLPFTKQEIADMTGTSMETAIRVMSRLKNSGIIHSTRGKTVILDEDKLQLLSSGPPLV
jgi:CRP-like cAMP-binding protein